MTHLLSSAHRKMLEEDSGLAPEVIAERGYYTATSAAHLATLHFAEYQRRVPALVLPVFDVHGQVALHQIRPDSPRKNKKRKPVKYETPAGAHLILDIHPAHLPLLPQADVPLVVIEGLNQFSRKNLIIAAGLGTLMLSAAAIVLWRAPGIDTHAESVPRQIIVHDTLADLSADELVSSSDVIVIGTITKVQGVKSASHIRKGKEDIFSDVTVAVEEYVVNTTGNASPELTLRVLGGKAGADEMIRESMEPFEKGQRVMLFLKKTPEGQFVLAADPQGRYTIQDESVGNSKKEARLLKLVFGSEKFTLSDFKSKVKK